MARNRALPKDRRGFWSAWGGVPGGMRAFGTPARHRESRSYFAPAQPTYDTPHGYATGSDYRARHRLEDVHFGQPYRPKVA